MSRAEEGGGLPGWARVVMLWLAGADMRITLLAIPPVLPLIHADLHLDETGVAAVSNTPVLLLGVAASAGSLLVAGFGARRALLAGLLFIGAGAALRGLGPSLPLLLLMTAVMGAGIAIGQTTLPALVRQWYPERPARFTSVWSNGLLVGELLSAALTIPIILPLVGGSWELSLAAWSVPVFATAALLLLSTSHAAGAAALYRGMGWPDWRSSRVWRLGLFQASAGITYFGANTFMPDYLNTVGRGDLVAPALALLNGAQIPASLVIGLAPWWLVAHRATLVGVAAVLFAGLLGLLSGQAALMLAAAAVFGFAAAYILVVCFALPAIVASATDTSRLSAGMNTISYVVSFLASLAGGAAWDATHQPATAFLPLVLGGVLVLVLGPQAAHAAKGKQPPARA